MPTNPKASEIFKISLYFENLIKQENTRTILLIPLGLRIFEQ